jgi:polyhydroxyalkanoate synthase subunit PhaC
MLAKNNQFYINKISIVYELLEKLINVYQKKFNKELLALLVPNVDLLKISLFKKLILETANNLLVINNLYEKFFNQFLILTKTSLDKKEVCLLFKKTWLELLEKTNLEHKEKRKLSFYFNNWLDDLSVQDNLIADFKSTILNTKNVHKIKNNFLNGIINCLECLIKENGYLDITINYNSRYCPLTIGENLATCKGIVVYKNCLMELIFYYPAHNQVFNFPVLFIPSCINKYYLFDLLNKKSLVQWLVKQGFAVYMISWFNPNKFNIHSHGNNCNQNYNPDFNEYINCILQAITIITQNEPAIKVHLAGYCMGGTMLSCLLAYMDKIQDLRVASASYFMSSIDFASFKHLDQDRLNKLENIINNTGFLDGKLLAMAFNIVHANELVWPFLINYYLFQKPLSNFDTLYWNCDPMNLPAKMYNFYLRDICYENKITKPNVININNVLIDISSIKVPIFYVAGEKDFISPWENCYTSFMLHKSSDNKKFILASGGHISALISPPSSVMNSSYTVVNNHKNHGALHNCKGSWWTCWESWLKHLNSSKTAANFFSSKKKHSMLKLNYEKAPGKYIFIKTSC